MYNAMADGDKATAVEMCLGKRQQCAERIFKRLLGIDWPEFFHQHVASIIARTKMRPGVQILDLAPYGRQQDWEDSPPGWPQRPTYG